jgi:phage terminase Nu1 subunit (DNA packaging protein)
MTPPLSLSAYAKRRGVSHVAVSKAIAAGRLSASVVRDDRGAPKIADPDLADREWAANTRPRIDHPAADLAGEPAAQAPRAARPPAGAPRPDVPDYNESRARRESALADMAEIEVAERRGELVPVDEARADVVSRFTVVRTRLLGVPSRVAQRLPHLAGEVVPILDELLREALEELALDGGATHDGAP